MQELFQELVAEVRRVNPDAARSLRPGCLPDLVKRRLDALSYKITPDAISLYSWADCPRFTFEILPGGYFLPFEEAFAEFDEIHAMRAELEEIFPERYRDCFRFLTDKSDGGYAFGRIDSPSEGQIVHLCIHSPWLLAFRNLEHLLRTSIECYRQGIMTDDSGLPDFMAYFELAAQMNPGMELYTAYQP
jgi:hypothetical protein